LNGWVLCQAELPAAMARDGLFPAFLAKAAPNGTPRNAHLFTTTLLTIVILMNSSRSMQSMFEFLIILTTSIVLVMYLGSTAAAFWLWRKGAVKANAAFPLIMALAAIYALWTIYGAGLEPLAWGLALLVAGIPIFALVRLSKRSARA
jgi:basic amino acid/polyamine antiporter, APA family